MWRRQADQGNAAAFGVLRDTQHGWCGGAFAFVSRGGAVDAEGVDPDNFLPPLTPYAIMKLGKVKLLPVFLPGDPAMGDAVRGLAGNGRR